MKKKLLLLWLLLPVPVIALHYGPGQRWMALDRAHGLVTRAQKASDAGKHNVAFALYREASAALSGHDETAKLRCEIAAVRAKADEGEAADALDECDRLVADPRVKADPAAEQAVREIAAWTGYHASWVMRLEGAARETWGPVTEEARQNFRLLAERETAATAADPDRKNLEATVRLQRMSLEELMAKPLPKECNGMKCKNLTEKMSKRQCKKCNGKKPGQPKPDDVRKEQKGAGLSERVEGPGS